MDQVLISAWDWLSRLEFFVVLVSTSSEILEQCLKYITSACSHTTHNHCTRSHSTIYSYNLSSRYADVKNENNYPAINIKANKNVIKYGIPRPAQISYNFRSHLQKLAGYIRNGNNIHANLFANSEPAAYMLESALHNANLKMLYNNMQIYRTIRIICRKFQVLSGTFQVP